MEVVIIWGHFSISQMSFVILIDIYTIILIYSVTVFKIILDKIGNGIGESVPVLNAMIPLLHTHKKRPFHFG